MTASLKDHAIAAGGALWERAGKSRVYLNRDALDALDAPTELRTGKVWIDDAGAHHRPGRDGYAATADALAALVDAIMATEADGTETDTERTEHPTPTYRQTRERRAEQLQAAAVRHAAASDTATETADRMASVIPFGQPILVGHYSEGRDRRYRARIGAAMDRAVTEQRAAEEAQRKAAEIRAQARGAIYSDDPDAAERLARKLAILEDRRDRIRRYNATARKARKANAESAHGDLSILAASDVDPDAQKYADSLTRHAWALGAGGTIPSYVAQNLGGVIGTTRRRLATMTRVAAAR